MHIVLQTKSSPEPVPVDEPPSPECVSASADSSDENKDDVHTSDTPTLQTPITSITKALAIDAREFVETVLDRFVSTDFVSLYGDFSVESSTQLKISCAERHSKIARVSKKRNGDAVIPETSTVLRPRLACPFYLHDREKHLSCLTRDDLRGIADLKEHLWAHHRQPSYCPTCYRTFTLSEDWGSHVRLRSCVYSGKPRPEGITALQMQLLSQPVDPWVSQHEQWLSVWDTVFPGVKAPILAPGEMEAAVWALREFWAAEGDKVLSSLLTERRQQRPWLQTQRISVGKLGLLVLEMAIDQLVARIRQGKDPGS